MIIISPFTYWYCIKVSIHWWFQTVSLPVVLNKFLRTLWLWHFAVYLKKSKEIKFCCCWYLIFLPMLSDQWTCYRSKPKKYFLIGFYIYFIYCISIVVEILLIWHERVFERLLNINTDRSYYILSRIIIQNFNYNICSN